MESGAHRFNLELLGWPKLEERRLQNRLTLFQKARLNLIDIPTDHLATKVRQTRQGGAAWCIIESFQKSIHTFIHFSLEHPKFGTTYPRS